MHWHAKDPASCYSHFLGVVLSITGLVTLLVESRGDPWRVVGFSIYGASLILLYSASTIYHWQALPPRGEDILKRLDHVAIFVLIAGTYTPVCLVTLRGGWGWSVLGLVWGLALLGLLLKLFFQHLPRWSSTALYVGMGWMAVGEGGASQRPATRTWWSISARAGSSKSAAASSTAGCRVSRWPATMRASASPICAVVSRVS